MDIESMTSVMCLVNRPERCSGQMISLAYVGPCAGPAHDPEPEPDQDEILGDALGDLLLEREREGMVL
jgi:hypothetical protein